MSEFLLDIRNVNRTEEIEFVWLPMGMSSDVMLFNVNFGLDDDSIDQLRADISFSRCASAFTSFLIFFLSASTASADLLLSFSSASSFAFRKSSSTFLSFAANSCWAFNLASSIAWEILPSTVLSCSEVILSTSSPTLALSSSIFCFISPTVSSCFLSSEAKVESKAATCSFDDCNALESSDFSLSNSDNLSSRTLFPSSSFSAFSFDSSSCLTTTFALRFRLSRRMETSSRAWRSCRPNLRTSCSKDLRYSSEPSFPPNHPPRGREVAIFNASLLEIVASAKPHK
mmetsp:Transcript_13623/g.32923  ORF Transcript_13623/g.32923 Transcript_13623/m.32923 type:complete len:286 (-) Transcript_13623:116-973(-)